MSTPISPARVLERLRSRTGPEFFERVEAAQLRAQARGDVPDPALGWIHAETFQAMLEEHGGALWRQARRDMAAGDPGSPNIHEAFALPALAHWRLSRGLYEFDETLSDALLDTPLAEVPADALRHLPEYAPYIRLPDLPFLNWTVHGAWLLRFLARDGNSALQMVLHHSGDQVASLSIGLTPGRPLDELLTETFAKVARGTVGEADQAAQVAASSRMLRRLLALVLYLSGDEPDLSGVAKPLRVVRRRGVQVYDRPQGDNMLRVGFQAGGAIRMWRQLEQRPTSDTSGLGLPKAPHIRRAHWHLYWTGKGRAVPRVRWVPPVAVNVRQMDDMPVQVRAVKDDPAEGRVEERDTRKAYARQNLPLLGRLGRKT